MDRPDTCALLIEERPDPADPDPFHPKRTRRRKYVEVRQE